MTTIQEPPNPPFFDAAAVVGGVFVVGLVLGLTAWWLIDRLREKRDEAKAVGK